MFNFSFKQNIKKIFPPVCFDIVLPCNGHGQKGLMKYKKEYWLRIPRFRPVLFLFFPLSPMILDESLNIFIQFKDSL